MLPTELLEEGQHLMTVCNSCRYCEGFCAVWQAMETRLVFKEEDLNYLSNLCHNCSECYYSCQYAPPHEFAINPPKTFAKIRVYTYELYAWPGPMAKAFHKNGLKVSLLTALILVTVMTSASLVLGGNLFMTVRDGNFYKIVPHEVMSISFWRPMEVEFDARYRSDFDRFVRDFLTLQLKPSKQLKAEEVYAGFRDYFYKRGGEPAAAQILGELRRHATYYVAFTTGKHPSIELARAFRRLRTLVEVAAPLMMRLYDCLDRAGTLSLEEFVEATELLESYVFRRSVCELETRSLGRIFASLAYEISESEPLLSLKITIALQNPNRRLPDDVEFKAALETKNIYSMRHCHYLLDRIENNSKERIDTTEFTIEHILPQNPRLPKDWRAMLGDGWKEIQDVWVHRLGNITLTGYNPQYSDRPFDQKMSVEGGFSDSPLRLNKFVKAQTKWTEAEMEKRGKLLASSAVKIWGPMQIDAEAVRHARLKRIKEEAAGYTSDSLAIEDEGVRLLLAALSGQVRELGPDITEIFRQKSVTYRVLDYFVEVIPRKQHLTLLLNIDFEDCDDPSKLARDATNKAFITNASETGGVTFPLWGEDDIPAALHLVRQAYEQVVD